MSQTFTAKKVKKPMSQQTKRNLANIFGSIISNQRAIDGAKELPIWVAIIFLLLSIFLPVIPMLVSSCNAYGSSFCSTYSYGLDVTLPELTYRMEQEGYKFEVKEVGEQKYLESTGTSVPDFSITPIETYVNGVTGEYNLMVYYSNANLEGKDDDQFSLSYLKAHCLADTYLCGTTSPAPLGTTENIYIPSFVILHKERIYVYLYKPSTNTALAANFDGCNWKNSPVASLLERTTNGADHNNIVDFNKKVFKNWQTIFDETYLDQKAMTTVASTFIYMGIYLGLVLFMGLMIFLLTRGKKNVYRYLSFLTCEKIGAWASFTPAVLGLILGFIFPQQSVIFFIMILGIRIMWLSMKQLRPQQY